jgi:hypothetical protein
MNTPLSSDPSTAVASAAPGRLTPHVYRSYEVVTAWLCWAAGYMLCVLVPITSCLWGTFAFTVVLFGAALWFLGYRNRACILRGLIQALVSVLLSVSYLVITNAAIMVCVFLFNVVNWFYTVFVLSGTSAESFPGDNLVREAAASAFRHPFHAPGNLFVALFGGGEREDGTKRRSGQLGKTLGWILLGLALALVPTLIVGFLLSYDDGFTALLKKLFKLQEIWKVLRNLMLGILLGAIAFGALLSSLTRAKAKKDGSLSATDNRSANEGRGTHVLPATVTCAALTPVLVLYVIFFVSQWSYYMSAFAGVRPEELTYADYARNGFFELCAVAGINAGLCILASLFTRRPAAGETPSRRHTSHPALRVFLCLFSVCTLVLIATALSKMFLYVDTYGLTQKRVYATWFMLLLAMSFVIVFIRQFCRRVNLMGTLLCIFLVFFLAISLVNVDRLIVSYNVQACLDGNVYTMQGTVLDDAGASGVLPALEFMKQTEGTQDPDLVSLRDKTDRWLSRMSQDLHTMEFGKMNISYLQAEKALQATEAYAMD